MNLSKKLYGLMLTAAVAGLAPSCGMVTETPDGPCPPSESVALSFHMITSGPMPASRADASHGEADSEYRQLEEGINVSDLGLFIFAKGPESTEEHLVLKTTNISESTDPQMMITGSPGSYTVTMMVSKDEMKKKLNYEITPDGGASIQFRVLILANCRSSYGGTWEGLKAETYTALMEEAAEGHFNVAAQLDHSSNIGDSDVAGIYKGRIPMFGTNIFSVTEKALYESGPSQRVDLGTVDLIRSLAKVRVVDNVQNKDADGYPKITEVEFIGSQESAYTLPAGAAAYVNGNQVHTPNIYEPDKTLTLTDAPVYKLGTISDGWNMTPTEERVGLTRIGYVPEQRIATLGSLSQGIPVFRITAALQKNADGTEEMKTYDVPMTGYYPTGSVGTPFEFGDYILRNHIYTLSVDRIAVGTPAEITVQVEEWTPSTFTLDFTESVSVPYKMQWLPSSYEDYDQSTGVLVMKPWTTVTDEDGSSHSTYVKLMGTFGIQTPQGATWTANLLTVQGQEGAFRFLVDHEDGSSTLEPRATGVVDGKTATIQIVTTDPTPSEANHALLQVIVSVGDGAVVTEAPVQPENAVYKYFTIVQNPL